MNKNDVMFFTKFNNSIFIENQNFLLKATKTTSKINESLNKDELKINIVKMLI